MIVVTGSSGFLGSAITESLGDAAITLSRSERNRACNHKADLTNAKSVGKFIGSETGKAISHLVHCAGITSPGDDLAVSVDAEIAESVARICRELHIRTLVLISGWVVYDPNANPPVSETAPLVPNTAYGRSKLAVERILKDRLENTVVLNLRASSVYGPGQRSAGLIPTLVKSAREIGSMTVHSLKTKRDYLYIDDLVRAVNAALNVKATSNVDINVGSGHSRTVKDVSEFVRRLFAILYRKDVKIRVGRPVKEATPLDNELAISKAKGLGLITTTTDFRKGLGEYIRWTER
jgi:UDP-glucose 4-epimerase